MKESAETIDESYQTVIDISRALTKSREVVNQSKELLNKLNLSNDPALSPIIDNMKSLELSSFDHSQHFPILQPSDLENTLMKENSLLRSSLSQLQKDLVSLQQKLKQKDDIIICYEKLIRNLTTSQPSQSLSNLNTSTESIPIPNPILASKLTQISSEYTKQQQLNKQLQLKLQECAFGCEKISDIEQKVLLSSRSINNLSKRLEMTEALLSRNATPQRLKNCLSQSGSIKLKRKKMSCALTSYKPKKLVNK